jgi:hypothetical protein
MSNQRGDIEVRRVEQRSDNRVDVEFKENWLLRPAKPRVQYLRALLEPHGIRVDDSSRSGPPPSKS